MFAREEPPHPSAKAPHPGAETRQYDILDITFDEVNANVAFKVG